MNREIPVVADEHVDPTFGTGAVKVTPAHDPNDFEIGRRHGLPMPTILDRAGRTSPTPERVSTAWTGSKRGPRSRRSCARRAGSSPRRSPYVHSVGHCSRSDDVVEPRLSTAVVRQGRAAGQGGRRRGAGRPDRHPPAGAGGPVLRLGRQHARLDHLPSAVVGAPDPGLVRTGRRGALRRAGRTAARRRAGRRTRTCWTPGSPPACGRSRRWAGRQRHRHPARVLSDVGAGHRLRHPVLLGRPDDDVRPVRDGRTSGQPAQAVRRGRAARPGPRPATARRCPSPRATGSTRWPGSSSTAPTPCGFTLARGANPGTDLAIADGVGGRRPRNFCSKLFNATRFALINGADGARGRRSAERADRGRRWILDRLDEVIARTTALLADFQFAKAAEGLYHFVWDEFCDWYLELAKVADPGTTATGRERPPARCSAPCWTAVLRLLHPFVPFVTETLWTSLTGGESAGDRGLAGAVRPGTARVRPRTGSSPTWTGWSPRSAGSAPTRGCRRPTGAVPARLNGAGRHRRGRGGGADQADDRRPERRTASRRPPRSTSAVRPARCTVELDTSGAVDLDAETGPADQGSRRRREGDRRHRQPNSATPRSWRRRRRRSSTRSGSGGKAALAERRPADRAGWLPCGQATDRRSDRSARDPRRTADGSDDDRRDAGDPVADGRRPDPIRPATSPRRPPISTTTTG